MDLPPAEELSRWTVSQVNNWLSKCSLSAFRDDFLYEGIDGSKLMRMKSYEVDQKYKHISSRKRNILIEHLRKIECLRSPPSWMMSTPSVPPRNTRAPAPLPVSEPPDDSDDEADWSEFEDDDEDADDYLEPASQPLDRQPAPVPGHNTNGNTFDGPEENYEIPEEDLEDLRHHSQGGFERKPTIVDRLRDELAIFKGEKEPAVDAPPPRPPRGNRSAAGGSPLMERRQEASSRSSMSPVPPRPAQPVPVQNALSPENAYEVMNDVISETQKVQKIAPHPAASGSDREPSPRRVKKSSADRMPEPLPRGRQGNNSRKMSQAQQEDELSIHDWYHGKIGRDHAQKIFQREQKDGMFLIRKSERDPKQPYTLVLWTLNRIWNIPIRKKDSGNYAAGKYKDEESEFSSVFDLVEHFKTVSLNLKSDSDIKGSHHLTFPAPRY